MRFEFSGHLKDEGRIAGLQGILTAGTEAGIRLFGSESPLSAEQLKGDFAGYAEYFRFS